MICGSTRFFSSVVSDEFSEGGWAGFEKEFTDFQTTITPAASRGEK
jgi:hypothetical protein